RGAEMLVGCFVVAGLARVQPEHETRHAMRALGSHQDLSELDRSNPVPLGRFPQERLLDEHLVLGIAAEGSGVEISSRGRVALLASEPTGKVAPKQRWGSGALLRCRSDGRHLLCHGRCNRGRCSDTQVGHSKQKPPCLHGPSLTERTSALPPSL